MDIKIEKTITEFYELEDMCWSGALDTLHDIANANKEKEFMDFLEMIYDNGEVTDTELNDFIWFERDMIYEHCGLDENGEEPMDEDEIEEMKREQETDLIEAETWDDFCVDRCCELCLFYDCEMKCEEVFAEYKNGNMDIDDILE